MLVLLLLHQEGLGLVLEFLDALNDLDSVQSHLDVEVILQILVIDVIK